MGVYTRNAVTVFTALFVLAQLCSADSPAAQSFSHENKLAWPSTGPFSHKAKLQSSSETSEDSELPERADLVADLPRTCANLSTKQLRKELLTYVMKQISKQSSGQERWKRTFPPKSGRKRIVYPIPVNNTRNTLIFVINVADINEKPIVIKLRLFDEKKGCPLRSAVKLGVFNSKKENENCVEAMKKRYNELVLGKYYDSKDESWIAFDVSQVTEKILKNVSNVCKNMDTAKLTIRVKNKCSFPKDEIQNPRQPYLEITNDPALPLECTPDETRCCRQPTIVMFKELGEKTSNILVPRAFRTGYCRGTCESQSGESPCCVPTKTTSLTYLYLDQRIEKKVSHDAVITECGCR